MRRSSPPAPADPILRWLCRSVFASAIAYFIAFGLVQTMVRWSPTHARDAALAGQPIAIAMLPLLILVGFAWQSHQRGMMLLGLLGGIVGLTGWIL
ncbi:hypothetical protein AA101099_1098 [Neoasaia chiangmaiensis NBRC 101099]|uniref:Uncharacterized protein n=2 Tax=Neoasaia chiangmaiensis TaxID=320497 RepID=A0A1U9KN26_9PROT|nr:hypothetical protein [Neoasaia chiangmaiensis]AQS87168.1 hypothetical protein A0U93_03585 [Neoasaia chiangmaiensis]GBR38216.1 hypothetical protein AA101099_1098 [Neoasaia chiangmaiensis NBRC 101099]GEN15986.1 hypothetical protein NCH01_24170 [Neoasaia chiangmaiensis]